MHGKFIGLARMDSLCYATEVTQGNPSFTLLFVDIINSHVRDCERALLGPVEHVRLLNLVGKEQLLSLEEFHVFRLRLVPDVVVHRERLYVDYRVNHKF